MAGVDESVGWVVGTGGVYAFAREVEVVDEIAGLADECYVLLDE